jgi:hypothetical protein
MTASHRGKPTGERLVQKKAEEGGGWFAWVFSTTDNLARIEARFGRAAVEGHRTRPNGTVFKVEADWREGDLRKSRRVPILHSVALNETTHHKMEFHQLEIKKIVISDEDQLADSWFKDDILSSLGNVNIEWVNPSTNEDQSGIVAIHLSTMSGVVILD